MMKLIDANFDEISGQSFAAVKYKGKIYQGFAHIHPEEEYSSKFTGCRYAEIRAQIKALKAERAEKIKACEECRKFVRACKQYKNWDNNSTTAKAIYSQLNKRIKEINKLTNKINHLLWDLKVATKQQDTIHKKLSKSKVDNLS